MSIWRELTIVRASGRGKVGMDCEPLCPIATCTANIQTKIPVRSLGMPIWANNRITTESNRLRGLRRLLDGDAELDQLSAVFGGQPLHWFAKRFWYVKLNDFCHRFPRSPHRPPRYHRIITFYRIWCGKER